ncbi:MAG: type I-D CRISPR-associated protein Cas10d/Csc3 [Thermoflexales bacterium]|nr:type I-D CRISPR-associated protein Cas10d/Csc3 [Thermoflexales bacterium]
MAKRKSKPIETTRPAEDERTEEELVEELEELEGQAEPVVIRLADEPMFSALLRAAVKQVSPDDAVMLDYVTCVAQPLSAELALQPAKGGEEFLAARRAEGKTEKDIARYRHEQSLRAHLVNGLFPAAHIARLLKTWNAPRLRHFDERVSRLFCAGFTLHDWLKLPEVETWLDREGLDHASVSAAKHLPVVEAIFRVWLGRLGLDKFLEPIGGTEMWLHDLIYLACNAQVRWGTMLNLGQLPRLKLEGRARQLATDLCTLADRIAYIAKTPREVTAHRSIVELITNLSDGQARLVYHHVAENRGMVTNFIHNAAMAAMMHPSRVPLLYAPSGVVYLENSRDIERPGAPPAAEAVADATAQEIQKACTGRLNREFTGLSRDGKGLKTAPYYDLHFTPGEQIRLAARAVFKMIPETKQASAGTRFAKLVEKGMAPDGVDLNLPDDIRVDQLAEFCAMGVGIAQSAAPDLDAAGLVLQTLELSGERSAFDAIGGAKGGGGVPYPWYYAAGVYLGRGKGKGASPDEWRTLMENLAQTVAKAVEEANLGTEADGHGWDDLRAYVQQVLTFGPGDAGAGDESRAIQETAALELARYSAAKTKGRSATVVCSLCSSAYAINPQREAGILFAPQVYTNKQPLHGSKAIRNICRICETEMMLRQILMNHGGALGSRFEGRRVRYLYFYPTYFFTPETLAQLALVYRRLRRVSFTSVRKALSVEENGRAVLRLDAEVFQRLEPLLMEPEIGEAPETDRMFRFHFPQQQPVAFYFLGVPPPSRDAKDAEAWINPAFLALILPLALDVKVVASESANPLLLEADELDETVFMDAPHDFVTDLVGRERISLEGLLPRLQVLTAAYLIHIDANARMGRGGYDYRWHTIPPLARNLGADPIWAFAYLKKWQRANGIEAIPLDKARLYVQFASILTDLIGGDSMSYAQVLTERYMQFYRAKRRNSNSILRPISIAAQAILDADPRLFDREGLIEVVRGELGDFITRVGSGRADGRYPAGSTWESREAALRQFAEYFVGDIFHDILRGDKSALRGKQLNLLKNACEVIYRDAAAQEWREKKEEDEEDS